MAVLLAAVCAAAGCAPEAARPAAPPDLELAIQAIGLQPEGGMPERLRLTVTSRAPVAVGFVLPRPLPGRENAGPSGAVVPMPLLGLTVSAGGGEESALYTDPAARALARPETVVLAPGASWSREYPLADFYLWGPTGPDATGNFTKYFWRGDQEVHLAAWLLGQGEGQVRSPAVGLRAQYEEWLLRKR